MHNLIKRKSSIINGPKQFKQLKSIKSCVKDKRLLKMCKDTMKNNVYFAHPHCILISMLGDEAFDVRQRAVNIINDIRCYEINSLDYYLPKIDVDAENYYNLCTFEKIDDLWYYQNTQDTYIIITEPPLLNNLDVNKFLYNRFKSDIPCHTQSVERNVAVTTKVTKKICGRLNQSALGMLVNVSRSASVS